MNNFMNKLASKFVKAEVTQAFKETGQPFSNLDISLANGKSNDNLVIGFTTRKKLKNLLQEDIDERTSDNFLDAARSFYKTAYNYCGKWLPLNDPFLKHCQFVNFNERLITMMPHLPS